MNAELIVPCKRKIDPFTGQVFRDCSSMGGGMGGGMGSLLPVLNFANNQQQTAAAVQTPTPAVQTPTPAVQTPTPATQTPTPATQTPTPAVQTPTHAVHTPTPATGTAAAATGTAAAATPPAAKPQATTPPAATPPAATPPAAATVTPINVPRVEPLTGTIDVPGVKIDQDWNNWKWEVVGNRVTLNGKPIRIRGVNWYGFEEKQMLPELVFNVPMESVFKTLAAMKFNAVRVTVSAEFLQWYKSPQAKVGSNGTIRAVQKDGSVLIQKYDGKAIVPDPTNDNPCKYGYIVEEDKKIYDGKSPAVVLDYFLKLAYKYNMIIMMDLHTMNATPVWNDHCINANTYLDIKDKSLENLKTDQPNDPAPAGYPIDHNDTPKLKLKKPFSVKLSDFVYAGMDPTYYRTYPYRDITQTKLLHFSPDDIDRLWVEFAGFCTAYPHVYCLDLKNEPHSGPGGGEALRWQGKMGQVHGEEFAGNANDPSKTQNMNWNTWAAFNNRLAPKVLAANPHVLIAVEGLDDWPDSKPVDTPGTGDGKSCWGGSFYNCKDPAKTFSQIPRNKLILSPHVYGMLAGRENLGQADWELVWGFLAADYNIEIGEWSKSIAYEVDKARGPAEDKYINALADYIQKKEVDSFFFAANYTSADTIACLQYDGQALSPNPEMLALVDVAHKTYTTLDFSKPGKM